MHSRTFLMRLWLLIWVFSLAALDACKKRAASQEDARDAATASDESSGSSSSSSSTNTTETAEVIEADEGSPVKGSYISIPDGALPDSVSVSLDEGVDLINSRNLAELGIDEANINTKGVSVKLTASPATDALKEMTLTMPMPTSIDGSTIDPKLIVGIALYDKAGFDKTYLKLIPSDALTIDRERKEVSLKTTYFGIYQIIYLKTADAALATTPAGGSPEIESVMKILGASTTKSLPAVTWTTPTLSYNAFSHSVTMTASFNSSEITMKSCTGVFKNVTAGTSTTASDGVKVTVSLSLTPTTAFQLKGYFQCTDSADRVADSPWTDSKSIPAKPRTPSFVIDSGSSYTSATSVTLTLSADEVSQMYITNTSGCASGGSYESFSTSKTWTLPSTNTSMTIYAKFKDQASNESSCTSATIIHDNQAPTSNSISIEAGASYINSTSVSLTLASTGASQMYISNTSGCASGGSWETYATSKSWTLAQTNGTATVYMKFRDGASNESSCISDTIIHDSVAPTSPTITISSGATYATSSSVSLGLSAANADEMYVTNTAGCASGGSWEAYSTGKVWTLGQSNGTARVYVKYRDYAHNETSCENDSITHDSGSPDAPSTMDDGTTAPTTAATPTFTWTAGSDSVSGISHYEIALGTSAGDNTTVDWTNVGNVLTSSLSSLSLTWGSTYYGSVRTKDLAGLASSSRNGDGFLVGWKGQAYIKAVNAETNDHFSSGLALNGSTLAVGAEWESSEQTSITNGSTGLTTDTNANGKSGAVYVYLRSSSSWAQQAILKTTNNGAEDFFGYAVDLDTDTIVVGAYGEDNGAVTGVQNSATAPASNNDATLSSGAAYVYLRTGTSWAQQSYFKAINAGQDDNFGKVVALSTDTVAVGAPGEDNSSTSIINCSTANACDAITDAGTAANSGAVYVYKRSSTTWTMQGYLKAGNLTGGDAYGSVLALDADTLVVGVPLEDNDLTGGAIQTSVPADNANLSNSGAVYVYKRTGTDWALEAYIKAGNASASDNFGAAVALSGDTLVVGAPNEDRDVTGGAIQTSIPSDNSNLSNSGAVYVYKRTGTTWAVQAYVKSANAHSGDLFGTSVSISGDLVVAGAPSEANGVATVTNAIDSIPADSGSKTNSGAAYVFKRTSTTWNAESYIKAPNADDEDKFAEKVRINSTTIAIGSTLEASNQTSITNGTTASSNNTAAEAGAAYIFKK